MEFKEHFKLSILCMILANIVIFYLSVPWMLIVANLITWSVYVALRINIIYEIKDDILTMKNRGKVIFKTQIENVCRIEFNGHVYRGKGAYKLFYKEFDQEKADYGQKEEYDRMKYFVAYKYINKGVKNDEGKSLVDVLNKQYGVKIGITDEKVVDNA